MSRLKTLHREFAEDRNGTIAIIFTFALFGLTMLIALGIDVGRSTLSRARISEALDAATLVATRSLMLGNPTDAEVAQLALSYFEKNFAAGSSVGSSWAEFKLKINRNSKTVTINVLAHVPTTFAAFGGFASVDMPLSSQATYSVNDIELGLALDITGSMRNGSSGGKPKIDELKLAAGKMFDILLPDTGAAGDVRIGIAPFSASVNAGPYADAVTHGKSTNCVAERTNDFKYTDTDPVPNNQQFEAGAKQKNDTDPTERIVGNAYLCPTAEVLPLTNDKDALKAHVNGFNADGWTAGHLGTQWGWYLVSPNWKYVWPGDSTPRDYGTKNLVKAVVVMTDGVYNTAYHNGRTSAEQAIAICDNAKAEGVVVYTVGFAAPSGVEPTLQACATIDTDTGKPFYFKAESEEELTKAFETIATKLSMLRVSQ